MSDIETSKSNKELNKDGVRAGCLVTPQEEVRIRRAARNVVATQEKPKAK